MWLDGPMAQDAEDSPSDTFIVSYQFEPSDLHFLHHLHVYAFRQTQPLTITIIFDRITQPYPSTVVIGNTAALALDEHSHVVATTDPVLRSKP